MLALFKAVVASGPVLSKIFCNASFGKPRKKSCVRFGVAGNHDVAAGLVIGRHGSTRGFGLALGHGKLTEEK